MSTSTGIPSPSPPPYIRTPRPKSILIIGGGVAGLAALRALVEEDSPFEKVELIERRDKVGGVWYLNEAVVENEKAYPGGTASGHWPISTAGKGALTNGSVSDVNGIGNGNANGINGHASSSSTTTSSSSSSSSQNGSSSTKPSWPSPAYPALRGNVLPRFLSFGGVPAFPPPADKIDAFPSLAETQAYLERIAAPLQSHIRCNTECLDVRELPGKISGENRWAIRTRDWNLPGGPERTEYFDAVVLSIGWTDKPLYPRMPGLEEAKEAGIVEHAKWYRGPEPYGTDSRIVVVGNGNSGNDIAAQLAAGRKQNEHPPVFRIARHKAWYFYVSLPDPRIEDVPAIESITLRTAAVGEKEKVDIKLVDGTVLEKIDRVIFASGYEIGQFPYVHLLARQPTAEEEQSLLKEGTEKSIGKDSTLWRTLSSPASPSKPFNVSDNPSRVPHLFWQLLHSRAATLALINLNVTAIPFWNSDLQAHCLRAIWDGSFQDLPDAFEDRLDYERKRIQWLDELRESEPERIKEAQERFIEEKELAQRSNGASSSYIPPEHTGAPPFHVLGTMVDEYGPPLREMVVRAKPQWEKKLPNWLLHTDERNQMYGLKRSILEKRRKQGLNLV